MPPAIDLKAKRHERVSGETIVEGAPCEAKTQGQACLTLRCTRQQKTPRAEKAQGV